MCRSARVFLVLGLTAAGLAAGTEAFAVSMYQAPGSMRDIDIGPGGQIYGIGARAYTAAGGLVYKWEGRNWVPFSGSGVRLTVDRDGNPWLVNSGDDIWRFKDGRWDHLPGRARDIDAGAGGEVFMVEADGAADGRVFCWTGSDWSLFGGSGVRITVDPGGHPWIVKSSGAMYRHNGSGWVLVPGRARSIDAGGGGTVYIIGADEVGPADGGIFRWTGSNWAENGGYGTEIAVSPGGDPAIVNSGDGVWGTFYRELPLSDFGFEAMRTRGRLARGYRPTLVILLEHSDNVFGGIHTRSYYDRLFFGIPPNLSINRYFIENSFGAFGLQKAGLIGPIRDPRTLACAHRSASCPGDGRSFLTSYAEALLLPGMEGVDFSVWDTDSDGRVTDDELLLVFVSAYDDPGYSVGGINRNFPGGCADTLAGGVQLCSTLALVGDGTNLGTIAHEMSHSLGTEDIYGAGYRNNGKLSLMAATKSGVEDDHEYYHLDPWHKIALGWLRPTIVPIAPGTKEIRRVLQAPPSDGFTARSLLLYDPNRGPNEFFLVEYRNAGVDGGISFDRNAYANGIVVWLVKRVSPSRLLEVPIVIKPGPNGIVDSVMIPDDVPTVSGLGIKLGPNRILDSVAMGDDVYEWDRVDLVVSPGDQFLGAPVAFTSANPRVNLRWLDWTTSYVELRALSFAEGASTGEVVLTFRHR